MDTCIGKICFLIYARKVYAVYITYQGKCFTDFRYYDLSNALTMECQVHVVHLIIAL